jgi:hypothetical protein
MARIAGAGRLLGFLVLSGRMMSIADAASFERRFPDASKVKFA